MTTQAQEERTPEQVAEHAAIEAGHGRVAKFEDPDEALVEEAVLKDDPAAKAAEEEPAKVEEEPKVEEDKAWQDEWVQTGNEDADAAIELMKAAGVKPVEGNEIFKEAIESGDISKARWDLLEARLGKAQARLVRNGVEKYYADEYKEQIEIRDEAFDKVGGEENWTKIQKWAEDTSKKDAKFAKTREEWGKALKTGGFAARAAIDAITAAYEAAPGNKGINNAAPMRGTKGGDGKPSGAPLSRTGYFEALVAAGGDRAPQSVKDALWARRAAGQAAGY